MFKTGVVVLGLSLGVSGQTKTPPPTKPATANPASMPCQVNYLPFRWTTKPAPTSEAQTKKYGPPPPVEHQGFAIQGMGNCDFTKSPPAPPKGFEKTKVQVKGPNLAFIELAPPMPTPGAKK